jgi:rhomboid protease GluP
MTTAPESPAPAIREAEEEARVEAGCYATAAEGFDHGLVALAMGCPYWLEESESGYRLLVPAAAAEQVREQLEIFDRENLGWPPPRLRETAAPGGQFSAALFLSALWALAVLAVFVAQGEWPGVTEAGAMDARAVFAGGEWWRAATALFLHADAGHLLSNLCGGVFLFAAVLMAMGRTRGSVLIATASVAANLAVGATYYPSEYR